MEYRSRSTLETITVQAPAKLNLFLHITGKRPDGYHHIQTVFQFIELFDTLHFTLRPDTTIHLQDLMSGIPPEDNLITRAALLLKADQYDLPGVDITLEKRIPMGSGMGGGSSDAAATLLVLNHLWKLYLPESTLLELARTLGADVPVFVKACNAFAEGIGEILTPIDLPERWYVVVTPAVHANTRELFSDPTLKRDASPITLEAYQAGIISTSNDFLPVLLRRYPELSALYQSLKKWGEPKLTGSGSAFFLSFETQAEAEKCIGQIPSQVVAFLARGLSESPLRHDWGVAKR